VTASSRELQPDRKWSVQYTGIFVLLQPLPVDFRSNDVISGSLSATYGHVTSFPVTWLPPPASYFLVKCKMYSVREFWPYTATSRWLPVKWRHFQVTSGHLRSRDVIGCHVTASFCKRPRCKKRNVQYMSFGPFTAPSRWAPIKWRQFRVTSDHLRSRNVISCHVTASSCELQPCRKWNVQYTRVFDLQPLQVDFRSNDVTSESFPITWGNVTSFSVTWLPPPASDSLVQDEMYNMWEFLTFYRNFQYASRLMTSLHGHFWSPEVMWRHFLQRECLLLRGTVL